MGARQIRRRLLLLFELCELPIVLFSKTVAIVRVGRSTGNTQRNLVIQGRSTLKTHRPMIRG